MSKNNKNFILAGVLFSVALFFSILPQLLGVGFVVWIKIVSILRSLILISYCFVFYKTKLSNLVYYIGVGSVALLEAYFFIVDISYGFSTYPLVELLFAVMAVVLMVKKAKPQKWLVIAGLSAFVIFAVIQIFNVLGNFNIVSPSIMMVFILSDISCIIQAIAVLIISLTEQDIPILKKLFGKFIKMTPEEKLASLKQSYDSGEITEQEYNQKKTKILNKL